MQRKNFTFLFYLFNFFQNFIFVYAVDKIIFQSRGISLSQIGILLALWSASAIFLEIPTGILADKWDRKSMLIIAGIANFLCYFIWLYSFSFWGFLIGYLFRSLGSAFVSGTMQAYLYDFLIEEGRKDEFEKVWGRSRMFNQIGIAAALILGGVIAQYSLTLVIILSLLPCLFLTMTALFFPQTKREIQAEDESNLRFVWNGLLYSFKHPILFRGFLFSGIILAAWGLVDEYFSLYFKGVGAPLATIGILYAAFYLASSSAGIFAHKFKNYSNTSLTILGIIIALVMIISGLTKSLFIIIPLIIIAFLIEIENILIEGMIQHNAQEEKRATVASVNSLLQRFDIILSVVFGFLAERFGLQSGFLFLGVFMLLFPLLNMISIGKTHNYSVETR